MIEWERDLMPEHLWIDLLAQEYNDKLWINIYNEFLDRIDAVIDYNKRTPFLGLISDFAMLSENERKIFLERNKEYIYEFFYKVVGKCLSFYPDNPANWLILEEWKAKEAISYEYELNKVANALSRLIKAKDSYTGHLRAIPLNRLFKHDRLRLHAEKFKDIIDLLVKYPINCDENEKYRVQQFARTTMNQIFMTTDRYNTRDWPKYFWRHNYDLIPCRPYHESLKKGDVTEDEEIIRVQKQLWENCIQLINYLDKVGLQYKYDLYDPLSDEIKIGLFSRIVRLYISFSSLPPLWSRDLSGVFLRCIGETAIIFRYFVLKATKEEINNFKEYSIGKEKLLMLHLQDTLSQTKTMEGDEIEGIAGEMGGEFSAELQKIELKNWTRKDIRKLALEVGMENVYRWVVDPSSADIHGSWSSIKKSNMVLCTQIMHRYHYVPKYFDPPMYYAPIHIATEIIKKCRDLAIEKLNCPPPEEELKDIPEISKVVETIIASRFKETW